MALSSLPSEFRLSSSLSSSYSLSLSSPCVFFSRFHFQSVSFKSRTSQKVRISCCDQVVQLDEDCGDASLLKRKRKVRPSFLLQVQKKWSLKVPSLRENFPWQEEPIQSSAQVPLDSKEQVKSDSFTERLDADTYRSSILAPWETVLDSDCRSTAEEIIVQEKQLDRATIHDRLDDEEILVNDFARGYENQDEEFTVCEEKYDRSEKLHSFSHSDTSLSADEDDTVPSLSPDLNEQCIERERVSNRNAIWAERHIPEAELKRLRNLSLKMVERIKVGAAGITQTLVDSIKGKWRDQELVKLKFEGPSSINMKAVHQTLERRTGGTIIWRSGSSVVIYRGISYNLDCVNSYNEQFEDESGDLMSSKNNLTRAMDFKDTSSREEQAALTEINLLLDDLGPRFVDWQGGDPIPVDADLLPAVVPGYKTPFRLHPYRTRRTLADSEMTFLRRMARTLPPHFALGRNRGLQGLAAAMVKLWEKSAVVVIAIKRGVLNTHNERMAEELKILTGGTLLSRNKEFIVFYRGNDFLPHSVSNVLTEAEKTAVLRQDIEEQTRNQFAMPPAAVSPSEKPLVAGTLAETVAATSRWGSQLNDVDVEKNMRDAVMARHASLLNSLQRKLALAKQKIETAEKTLQKVLRDHEPQRLPTDLETLTEEERAVLRRIGMSMKPCLELGRREVFDGTVENMHLHWKYRELVKIVVKRKSLPQVKHIAISLEAESGGVLVSVERIPNGNHVIIVYRGKNYLRPLRFRPQTLLSKREALVRSVELQRREALRHHAAKLEENIEKMKREQEDMEGGVCESAEKLASRLHLYAAVSSSDEDE